MPRGPSFIKVTTYQGKLTYLMIGFLYQTRTGFSEIVSLTIGNVYRNGRAKKTMIIGEVPRQRTQILDDQASKIINDLVVLQVQRGHQPRSDAPSLQKALHRQSFHGRADGQHFLALPGGRQVAWTAGPAPEKPPWTAACLPAPVPYSPGACSRGISPAAPRC